MTAPPSHAATTIIAATLAPEERLLWAGRPKQGFALRAADLLFIPFLLLWLSGVLCGGLTLWRQEDLTASWPLGLFFLFGAVLLFSRYWFDARMRGRTFYGVSDRRAIVVTCWLEQEIVSVYHKELLELRFTHRSDGTGTLEFLTDLGGFRRFLGGGLLGYYDRSQLWWPGTRHWRAFIPPAFEMIAAPREVERLIVEAREKARAAS